MVLIKFISMKFEKKIGIRTTQSDWSSKMSQEIEKWSQVRSRGPLILQFYDLKFWRIVYTQLLLQIKIGLKILGKIIKN